MLHGALDRILNRRELARRTWEYSASLATSSLLERKLSAAEGSNASAQRLVLLGLNALARSPEYDYFRDGHRGASLVAADLLVHGNGLDEDARARIVELFDLTWGSSPLCQTFPDEDADPTQIKRIGDALAEGGGVLRQVGHDAIFAMLAIKAFRMAPEAATPQRIDGVCRLIRSFTAWRDDPPDPAVDPPPFEDSEAASRFILREAIAAVDKFVGFGQGYAGHMLTFGQALVELAAMGDVEYAESCRTAFRKYVTVTRLGPAADDRRIPDHAPSSLRPRDTEYWCQRGDKTLGIGHVFKYPYSYYDLLQRANDSELSRQWDEKAYHIF